MNQLILFLLLLGIIFVVSGFLELYFDSKQTRVEKEYRIVPRDVYDQIAINDISDQFGVMFDANDPRNNTNLI